MPQTATHTTPCCCPHAFPPSEAASRACRPLCCCSGSSLAWARSGPGSSTSTAAPPCGSRCPSREAQRVSESGAESRPLHAAVDAPRARAALARRLARPLSFPPLPDPVRAGRGARCSGRRARGAGPGSGQNGRSSERSLPASLRYLAPLALLLPSDGAVAFGMASLGAMHAYILAMPAPLDASTLLARCVGLCTPPSVIRRRSTCTLGTSASACACRSSSGASRPSASTGRASRRRARCYSCTWAPSASLAPRAMCCPTDSATTSPTATGRATGA
mmetsp:Transcript_21882/g.72509  ORF Transcript_21882/g.72509 Transcript_21882/m.72509 type:complete len:276 (-) Transcript_21882:711-1538(-)